MGLAIVAFPVLKPQLPGHVAPEDLLMALSILAVLMWAGTDRIPIHVPYAVPMGILAVTGLLAAQFSIAPALGVLAVFQEAFLLAWAAALVTFARTPRNLSMILSVWAWSATAWATLLVVAVNTHQWWAVGAHSANGARAQLWFDNPNMAGNYFLVSLFVVILGKHPRRPLMRVLSFGLLTAAIVYTGSNAALLSLALGLVVTLVITIWRRVDLLNALAVASLAAVLMWGFTLYAVDSNLPQTLTNSSNEIVARSVARTPKSVEGRTTLFAAGMQLYRTGSLLGRGPASTRTTLDQSFTTSKIKEAHNDYLATLVERGPLGVIGLLILAAGIGMRAFAVSLRPLKVPFARVLMRPSALAGIVVVLAFTAVTHEVLHYRHAWALFGVIAALYLYGLRHREPELEPRTEPRTDLRTEPRIEGAP